MMLRLFIVFSFVLSTTGCDSNWSTPRESVLRQDLDTDIHAGEHLTPQPSPLRASKQDVPWWLAARDRLQIDIDSFEPDENTSWVATIPGRGHASPSIVGDRVFLPTTNDDGNEQIVLCFDRQSGKRLWRRVVHSDLLTSADKMHDDSTHASSTIASDGSLAFVVFLNDRKIVATALTKNGEIAWSVPVGNFTPYMGYSSSPTIFGAFLFVAADDADGGFIAALDCRDGTILWRKSRPPGASHSSPAVVTMKEESMVVVTGLNKTIGYALHNGMKLWEVDGPADTTVATAVAHDNLIFTSGGYPQQGVYCHEISYVNSEWKAALRWKDPSKVYVPSLLPTPNGLFGITDNGIANLWNMEDGARKHRLRLKGDFYASPIRCGDTVLLATRNGCLQWITTHDSRLQLLTTHQVADEIVASPVGINNELFLRMTSQTTTGLRGTLTCLRSEKINE